MKDLWLVRLALRVPLFVGLAASFAISFGQTVGESPIPPPKSERFKPMAGPLVPWIDSGCHPSNHVNEPDCQDLRRGSIFAEHGRVALHNEDGSLWFRFSSHLPDSDHFLATGNRRSDFRPFSSDSMSLVLRIKAESPNWYEVEIDEESRETRYASKAEKLWAKVTWNYLLNGAPSMYIDGRKIKLLDGPNGKAIEETSNLEFHGLKFLRDDGDWALVFAFLDGKGYQGWIRWKDGRKLLVGCRFNKYKVPE